MSEILAAAAIGLGGGIATFVAIQQVGALIKERRNAIRTQVRPDERARPHEEIMRLRAVNAKLLAALEARGCEVDPTSPCITNKETHPYASVCQTCAAIEEVKK